jgi:predicted nucleic acid-binding protein
MAIKVIDASALAALLFGEPEAEEVAAALDGTSLVAPALLDFELANVCVTKCKRYPDQREAFLAAFQLSGQMGIGETAVDHGRVIEIALTSGLTAYDASYLWLARQLGADLVTLDEALGRIAAAK